MKFVDGPGKWFIYTGAVLGVAEIFSSTVAGWDQNSTSPIPVWVLLIGGGLGINLVAPKGSYAK